MINEKMSRYENSTNEYIIADSPSLVREKGKRVFER